MKLLALADLHDRFAVVAEAAQRTGQVDAIVLAGDLTTNGTPAEVEPAVKLWRPLAPRLFAVAGNMDSPAIDQALERLGVSINGACQRAGDFAFFGCSASPVSVGTPYEIPESEIAARLERGFSQSAGAALRVCVPHAPPRGVVDRAWTGTHAGSEAVRDFIDRVQPDLVLCGHIHEARGQARLGRSLVVNCGPARRGHYAVVELDGQVCSATLF
jgi:hypothetical protein